MQVEPSKLEEITLPAPGHPITIWSITGHTGQIRHFCLQFHDPLEKWVQEQVILSKSEEVKFQTTGFLQVFRILQPN
jgi:hypothetical protein